MRSNTLRRLLAAATSAILGLGVLLALPGQVSAVESSAKLITALGFTASSGQFQLRNRLDTANATFSAGAGTDAADTDEYYIRLYHSAISLIPTVSAKAEWSCGVAGDGVGDDENCSIQGLSGGDSGTISITVTAENGTTNDYLFTIEAYDSDVTLDDLTTDVGTLTPAFSSSVTSYKVITAEANIDLDPSATSASADVVCKKGSTEWAGCTGALTVGANTLTITVKSDSIPKFQKTYTVQVTRVADNNAEIEAIEFSHGGLLTAASSNTSFTRTTFLPTVVSYDFTSNEDEIDVTVDLKDEGATFDCEGNSLADMTDSLANADGDSCAVDLTGANADTGFSFTITVTASNLTTTKTYTFTTRLSTVSTGVVPALTPDDDTVRVGSQLAFDPTGATVRADFDNETAVQYQWYVCDDEVVAGDNDPAAVPDGCEKKAGAILATYRPTASDAGKHVIGALVGQPGNVLAYTESQEVLAGPGLTSASVVPVPVEAALVGTETGGFEIELENIDLADFTGITDASTELSFRWFRCSSASATALVGATIVVPDSCKRISGAEDDSYSPADDPDPLLSDAGKYIRARITVVPDGSRARYVILTRSTNRVYGPATATAAPRAPTAPGLTVALPEKLLTASKGTWSGFPTLDTTVAENYLYEWYACYGPVEEASTDDPSLLLYGGAPGRCFAVGETGSQLTVSTDLCGLYLLVGVSVNNEDFRGKGGWSSYWHSLTSATTVSGTACD